MLDLSGDAMGFFRGPLIGTALAFFFGTLLNWFFRRRGNTHAANWALVASASFDASAGRGLGGSGFTFSRTGPPAGCP